MAPNERRRPALPGRRVALMITAVVVVASATLFAAGRLVAHNGFDLSGPASTPGSTGPSASPPNTGPAPWLVTPASLSGRTLHWMQLSYAFSATSPDPANGQIVTGSIWEQVGNDGVPTVFYGHYTLSDGTFLQDILQTPKGQTVQFGPPYAGKGSPCFPPSRLLTAAEMRSALPPFADQTLLANAGFSKASLTKTLPTIPPSSFAGASPEHVFDATAPVSSWTSQTGGATAVRRVNTIVVDAQGRVLETVGQIVDGAGTVTSETRGDFGSLEIYTPTAVPASVFPTGEVCNG